MHNRKTEKRSYGWNGYYGWNQSANNNLRPRQ
jgi:hypothetical protein